MQNMKVAALVSGGVDSSVALALLKEQGHAVTAYYLKIWLEDDLSSLGECPWEDDLSYVRSVCEKLDVELKIINLQKEYWDRVVNYCIEQVKLGYTPNPDVLCNSRVKFAAFFDAVQHDFDFVATGHYADTQYDATHNVRYLRRVRDQIKDQTYFLANLNQSQVQKIIFPLAPYLKEEIRELAHKFDLPNKHRKDSQGICFLGKIKYADFLKHYLKEQKGDIIEITSRKKIGSHNGYWYFTIGQRKGMGLGGGPWIVVDKDLKQNIVFVQNELEFERTKKVTDASGLVTDTVFTITNCNWIATPPPPQCKVKLRHGPKIYSCELQKSGDDSYIVTIPNTTVAVAPGQYAVFYDDVYCYGCGVVSSLASEVKHE